MRFIIFEGMNTQSVLFLDEETSLYFVTELGLLADFFLKNF